jgi:dCMP deaminase
MKLLNQKWINRWMGMCDHISLWSEDESTKVGCVVVSRDMDLLSIGWNGLARGVKNKKERNERPLKYKFFEHAERNAIANSSRNGVSLKNSILFVPQYPCADCSRLIIQSGIKEVYVKESELNTEFAKRWKDDILISEDMMTESGIIIWKV